MGTHHGRKERDVPGSDVLRQRRTPQLCTPATRKWRRRRAGRDSAVHSRRVQPRRAGFLNAFERTWRPGSIARPPGHSEERCDSGEEYLSVIMDTATHLATCRPHPIQAVDAAKSLN